MSNPQTKTAAVNDIGLVAEDIFEGGDNVSQSDITGRDKHESDGSSCESDSNSHGSNSGSHSHASDDEDWPSNNPVKPPSEKDDSDSDDSEKKELEVKGNDQNPSSFSKHEELPPSFRLEN